MSAQATSLEPCDRAQAYQRSDERGYYTFVNQSANHILLWVDRVAERLHRIGLSWLGEQSMLAARVTLQKPPLIRIFRQSPGLGPFSACLPATPRFHSCRALAQFAGMWGRAKPPSKVQLLVDLVREVFDGDNVPRDTDILRVKAALSTSLEV